jgi:MFS family permease
VLGLSPSFLHEELTVRITRPVVSGLFAALVLVANLVSQFAFRRYNTPRSLRTALVVMVVGMAIIASSSVVGSLGVALVGALITGAGAGVVQMNTTATILRISPVHARGAVSSAFFTVAYVGMALPVLIAGISADRFGLAVVADWYVVALACVAAAAMVAARGQTVAWASQPEDPVLVPPIAECRP